MPETYVDRAPRTCYGAGMSERSWEIGENLTVLLLTVVVAAALVVAWFGDSAAKAACYEAGHSPEECGR